MDGIETVIPPNATCQSACALVFLGGRNTTGLEQILSNLNRPGIPNRRDI
jgi:hypothetical protein